MDTFLTIVISAIIGFYVGGATALVCVVHWLNQTDDRR